MRDIDFDDAPERAADPRNKRWKRVLAVTAAVLLLLCVAVWWLIGEMLGYTTYSRMQSKCARAHSFANTAELWIESGHKAQTGIYRVSDDGAFGSFVLQYFADAEGDWFGLVLDADGKIEYALYSDVRIPERYLAAPPVYEEHMALLDSHFAFRRRRAVAVWYADDSGNTLND